MREQTTEPTAARRSFLSRLGMGAAAFGAAWTGAGCVPRTGSIGGGWAPSRHTEDDWMDRMPGVHRFILDNTTATGFARAMLYANNFFEVNRYDYGLDYGDLAVILVARHYSTPFAFNDAMWKKYGAAWNSMMNFNDPRTGAPPTVNLYNAGPIVGLENQGRTLDGMFEKGMKIALCQVATQAITVVAANALGVDPSQVLEEVMDNLLEGVQPVPAGIVAVNRAQERGYTFSFTA